MRESLSHLAREAAAAFDAAAQSSDPQESAAWRERGLALIRRIQQDEGAAAADSGADSR